MYKQSNRYTEIKIIAPNWSKSDNWSIPRHFWPEHLPSCNQSISAPYVKVPRYNDEDPANFQPNPSTKISGIAKNNLSFVWVPGTRKLSVTTSNTDDFEVILWVKLLLGLKFPSLNGWIWIFFLTIHTHWIRIVLSLPLYIYIFIIYKYIHVDVYYRYELICMFFSWIDWICPDKCI